MRSKGLNPGKPGINSLVETDLENGEDSEDDDSDLDDEDSTVPCHMLWQKPEHTFKPTVVEPAKPVPTKCSFMSLTVQGIEFIPAFFSNRFNIAGLGTQGGGKGDGGQEHEGIQHRD